MELKIKSIGNSAGVVLPKDILARLRVEKGDTLYVTETADGITLRPYNEKFAEQMALAESIMQEDKQMLHKLADS